MSARKDLAARLPNLLTCPYLNAIQGFQDDPRSFAKKSPEGTAEKNFVFAASEALNRVARRLVSWLSRLYSAEDVGTKSPNSLAMFRPIP